MQQVWAPARNLVFRGARMCVSVGVVIVPYISKTDDTSKSDEAEED